MMHHHQLKRPWLWALAVGGVLLIGRPALTQVTPPPNLLPLAKFSVTGKASGSETNQTSAATNQTSAADYTVKFTLSPDRVLDPPAEALLLRIESDAETPDPCADVFIPKNCFFPTGAGSFAVSENCPVSVKAFKEELNYVRDLTPLLQNFSATLQQVQGEWQARIVTAFTEAVARPTPCAITFTVGTHGVENMPISRSDLKWGAALP
jgi:hypothetical protein